MAYFSSLNSNPVSGNSFHLPALSFRTFNFSKWIMVCLLLLVRVGSMSGATINSTATGGNWNSNGTWAGGAQPATTDVVVIANGATVNTNGNQTCAGITITGTLNMASGNVLTVNGDVSGAGTWTTGTTNLARTISLTGNWSFSGISTGSRAAATFTGTNDQTLSGLISTGTGNAANALTINKSSGIVSLGSVISVNTFVNTAGTFDPGTFLLTAANRTFTAGTLRVGGANWAANYSGAITQPASGIIEYDAPGNQTVNDLSYPGHLVISGSGTKTWTLGGGRTVTGNLSVNSGELSITGNQTLGITGVTNVSGTLTLGGTSVKTFTGNVTINSGGVLTETTVEAINYASDFTNNGTYTTTANTTGVHTFTGAVHIINGSGAIAMPYLTINNTITNNSTVGLTVSTALAGSSTLTQGVNSILKIGGTSAAFTLNASTNANTVNYNGAGPQTVKVTAYSNLILSGSGVKTIVTGTSAANNFSISGATASLNAGISVNAGSLTLGGLNTINGSWGSTTSAAANTDNTYFAATTGIVIVGTDTRSLTPTFSGLTTNQSICFGTTQVTLSGTISAAGPVYPANGEIVAVTINGISQNATISGAVGGFTLNYPTASIAAGTYAISYSFAGNKYLKTATTDVSTSLTVNSISSAPTTTGAFICIGTVAGTTLFASGAISGQKYNWYSAATGGSPLYTSADNTVNTYTTPVILATTSYWVTILNAGGCESPRAQVTATYPSVCTDAQTPGTDSWIGYVYSGQNTNFASNIYYGHYTEPETINESFGPGNDISCFPITSNSNALSINTVNFSVRYLMNSTKTGLYTVDLGSDDGNRLTVDGTLLYSDWANHATSSHPRVLMNLKGNSTLMYEYYENNGGNVVLFQNLTQLIANNLSTNTTQTITVGNTGAAISGDVFNTLTGGISLSGTGYQWTYSTTPGGARTSISGATGATYTPNATIAPFNTPGIYYLFRNAILSSTNNVSPNPYIATNESNAATLTTNGSPFITPSVTTLTGFTYVSGSGPSTEQSFTVSGNYLNANIMVTPPTNFEISTGTGSSFVPQNLITLNVINSTVPTTTIYVRMKAGLLTTPLDLPENIVFTSTGATTQNVACSGSVIVQPVIITSTPTLSGFNYNFGSGPSVQQSFTVSGSNLTGNIVITPPTNYEISLASGSGYTSSLTLTQSGGIVASTSIYVRLKTGLVVNTYSGNVVLTSSFAGTQNVFCSGSVTAPIVTVSTFNLAGFIYTLGSGPSAYQTVSVTGSNLTNNISVNAPAGFEISTDKTTYNSTITLTQSGGSVSSTKIYVRLVSGLGVGTYGPLNLTFASNGSITQNVICSGKVVNSPTLIGSVASLNGFMYLTGNGPSGSQTFTVSGASLTADITLAPPANFEISTDFGATYSTGSLSITKPVSGLLNPTIIYVRLIIGKSPATYSGNLGITSGVATPVSIALSGQVLAVPSITSGATPGASACIGNTVTLNSTPTGGITNVIWTGPNGYYSQLTNPPVPITGGTVAATDAGIYTVTGNVLSGVNLLTNGDFESGIGGFGSSYGYVVPSANALGPEGLYTIIGDGIYTVPNNVHNNDNGFGNCDDHTHLTVPGAKHQMVINGNVTAGVIVWSESVSVKTGSDYQFSYYVQSVNPAAPSVLQLYVNGVPAGPMYTASSTICNWTKFIYNTNADVNTVLQLTLINQNTAAGGNDFALDDLVFQQVYQVQSSVNLVINPVLAPGLTVTASGNPVYTNTPVTFTATPTNGGATPAFQWSTTNPVTTGPTGSTYTFIPSNGQVVSCVMTSSLPCASPSTASNQVTMTVNQRSNYWLGSVGANGTDWGTPANWTAGTIPAPGNDVEYATTGNAAGKMAVNNLQLDQDRTIGSLINATSQSLIIPAGNGLIVNQMITTGGDPGLINIKSAPLSKNGSLIYHNPSSKPVFATVEMYSMASYDSNGPVNGKYKWQYFGIPLSSVVANPTFYGSYVRSWDETGTSISNHWVSLNNNSTLLPFNGYEITQKNATTIVFQGQLVNNDSNFGQLTVTPTALYPGEHIYANPYTAAIDIRQLNFGSDTEATVYLYNTGSYNDWLPNGQSTPGNNPGQYTAVPKSTAGNSGIPRQIPSMQGFLIKAITPTSTPNCTFGISYNSVAMTNSDAQRAPGIDHITDDSGISTRIDLKGTNYGDRLWLFTQPNCTQSFDNGWDGRKMTGNALTPQIFAIEPDGNYQVNAVSDINNTILGFQAGSDTEYTMTFMHTNLANSYAALFLVDLVENKTVDITQSGSSYSFVSESTPAPVSRFMIATRAIVKNAPDANTQLKVFNSGHVVFVQNLSTLNGEMIVYDMMGNILKREAFGPFGVTDIQLEAIPGAYVVNASTSNERVSKRIILGE